MGLMQVEKTFPRGGKKPSSLSQDKSIKNRKKTFDIFKIRTEKVSSKTKKSKKAKGKKAKESTVIQKVSSVEPLTYKTLVEGMLILGCIHEVRQYDLWISLPGHLIGRVPITLISSQYSKALQAMADENEKETRTLSEMFYVGQHVVAKVMELSHGDNRTHVTMSLSPDELHSELTHSSIQKGMVLTGALSSIEDHGYLIDFGIKYLRAFLKKKDANNFINTWNENLPLGEGQLLRCLVTKTNSTIASTTLEVTIDPKTVASACTPKEAGVNPHLVVPGMRFKVYTSKILREGVQLTWQNFEGFIHQDHLPEPLIPSEKQSLLTDSAHVATVLYSLPMVRSVFFTLLDPAPLASEKPSHVLALNGTPEDSPISLGQTLTSATIIFASYRGIVLKLPAGTRGFVPLAHIKEYGHIPEDVRVEYPIGTKVTCRVVRYDPMDQVFICTMQKSLIGEKVLVVGDAVPGMSVQCRIVEIKTNGLLVQIGRSAQLRALVPIIHATDTPVHDLSKRFQLDQLVKGRVLKVSQEKRQLHVTFKPSLVRSEMPILSSYAGVPSNTWFDGTVVWIGTDCYLVSFYNDVAGKLHLKDIPGALGFSFVIGQVVTCRVLEVDPVNSKLKLSMMPLANVVMKSSPSFLPEVGCEYDIEGVEASKEGLHVAIKDEHGEISGYGLVPVLQVSDHLSLASALVQAYSTTFKGRAICLSQEKPLPLFSVCPTAREIGGTKEWCINALLPCTIVSIVKRGLTVKACIQSSTNLAYVPSRMMADQPIENASLVFRRGQGLICRVNTIQSEEDDTGLFKALVSCRLKDVGPIKSESGFQLLQSYLSDTSCILNHLKEKSSKLVELIPGQVVKATVGEPSENGSRLQLEGGIEGFVSAYHSQGFTLKKEQEVHGIVLWLDVAKNRVEISLKKDLVKLGRKTQDPSKVPKVNSTQRGQVVVSNEYFTMSILKGQHRGSMVFSPARQHINDVCYIPHSLGDAQKLVILSVSEAGIIAAPKRNLVKAQEPMKDQQRSPSSKKRRVDVGEELESLINQTNLMDIEHPSTSNNIVKANESAKDQKKKDPSEKRKADVVEESKPAKKQRNRKETSVDDEEIVDEKFVNQEVVHQEIVKTEPIILPRLEVEGGFQWNVPEVKDEEESSGDESEEEKPKKRLTLAEKRELARKEESRLRQTEERLMDEGRTPQTADDFDRLVMASPDSSIIWIQYIAFHLQATEIEKARAVAHKAIKTISFREEQEKLNVWVALLNLENLYGTQDSLAKTLQEATQLNDSYKVHCHMLQIYTDANKVEEGDALFDTMLRKFRSEKDVWVNGATFYLCTGQLEKGRNLLQRALRSLDKKLHVDVISQFAHLENRWGSPERAQTLFEHMLSSFPRRTDVWLSYVALLVKSNNQDAARHVLERAASQKLPARKMKIIFRSFIEFELNHGTEEGAEVVRQMAQEYVKSLTEK